MEERRRGSSDSAAEGMDGQCYVVGMHCAARHNHYGEKMELKKSAVLMTKAVVKQLAKFERELTEAPISTIQLNSVNFNQITK